MADITLHKASKGRVSHLTLTPCGSACITGGVKSTNEGKVDGRTQPVKFRDAGRLTLLSLGRATPVISPLLPLLLLS